MVDTGASCTFLSERGEMIDDKRILSILALSALGGVIAILLAACAIPFIGSEAKTLAQEREALVALYNATGGADWRNNARWLSDQPVETWHGILYYSDERLAPGPGNTTKTVGGVSQLRLESNGLRGQLPPELGNFKFLSRLYLGGNQLTGEIPSQLGNLDSLTHLHLGGNQLSGEIPPELGKLRFLSYFYLGGNQLSGEIPSELDKLRDLITLDLSNNHLTGEIPDGLGRPRRFSNLDLSGNQLTGEIPPGLGALYQLYLHDNDLSGEIPPGFGRHGGMRALYLGGNRLTGCIPSGLSSVQENDFLRLGLDFCGGGPLVPPGSPKAALVALYNATGGGSWSDDTNWMNATKGFRSWYGVSGPPIRGQAPGYQGRVQVLSLNGNNLSGELPPELVDLKDLLYLNLADNNLTGEIPSGLDSMKELIELDLSNNRLSGEIPPELTNLPRLRRMYLGGNQFTGCIPGGLRLVAENDLSELGLPFCGEQGTVVHPGTPTAALVAIYNATGGENWRNNTNWLTSELISEWYGVNIDRRSNRIIGLHLNGNNLSGEIPPQLGDLESLKYLNLAGNNLTGEIAPELGDLRNLEKLDLHGNDLSGEIPSQLGNLERLLELHLHENRLSGDIPPELGNLRSLEALLLGGNGLDGVIPAELGRLDNLERLALSENGLTGEIPAELGNLGNLIYLYLEDNRLGGYIPPQLGDAQRLSRLFVDGNRFIGCIPSTLRSVEWNDFLKLGLDFCGEGPLVPPGSELEALVALYYDTDGENWLDDTNWLTSASIGSWYGVEIMGRDFVQRLSLEGNNLSGEIPPELINLRYLTVLNLSENDLSGNIPDELGRMDRLIRLDLRENRLTGKIPPGLHPPARHAGISIGLDWLYLGGNQLSGCIHGRWRAVPAQRTDVFTLGLPGCELAP